MKYDLFFLQSSHALYVLASIKAWQKGYRGFSIFLTVMIALSLINHTREQMHPYSNALSNEVVEWMEKLYVGATIAYAAIEFRRFISQSNWIFIGICLFVYFYSDLQYYLKNMFSYVIFHSLWHLGTGSILIRIIDASPQKHE